MTAQDPIRKLLADAKTIAVVGLSDKEHRDSHQVARYLQAAGYRIIPINPRCSKILGETCYPDLESVPTAIAIDIVDVFRRGEETPPVARAAVAAGARLLWLQRGIDNDETRAIAQAAKLPLVVDRCLKVDHATWFR